jgi:hypothetical protein
MKRSLPGSAASYREAVFVALLWVVSALYTVGYAVAFAYRKDAAPSLLFGIPTWVVWGVLLPWAVCTLASFWFALYGMQDEELGPEPDAETSDALRPGASPRGEGS